MEEEVYEWGKVYRNKKHKWLVQNRQGEVKNSIGNGEAKELTCTNSRFGLPWKANIDSSHFPILF